MRLVKSMIPSNEESLNVKLKWDSLMLSIIYVPGMFKFVKDATEYIKTEKALWDMTQKLYSKGSTHSWLHKFQWFSRYFFNQNEALSSGEWWTYHSEEILLAINYSLSQNYRRKTHCFARSFTFDNDRIFSCRSLSNRVSCKCTPLGWIFFCVVRIPINFIQRFLHDFQTYGRS